MNKNGSVFVTSHQDQTELFKLSAPWTVKCPDLYIFFVVMTILNTVLSNNFVQGLQCPCFTCMFELHGADCAHLPSDFKACTYKCMNCDITTSHQRHKTLPDVPLILFLDNNATVSF